MSESILTKSQEKIFHGTIRAPWDKSGFAKISVAARWDDCCGNGHNSLGITGFTEDMCGCLHREILESEGIPVEIKDLVPFHLCDPEGPMYYIINTLYHVQEGHLGYARDTAVANWPEGHPLWVSDADLGNEKVLEARRPLLVAELRKRLEAAGFVW